MSSSFAVCLTAAAVVKNRCKGKGKGSQILVLGKILSEMAHKGSFDLIVDSGTRVTDSNAEPFDHGGRN